MDIPTEVKKYFWDSDISKADLQTRQDYIIARLLEYGNLEAARWLLRSYPREKIIEVLKNSRSIAAKSGIFWASFFAVSPNALICLKKSFRQLQKSHWNG